MRYIGIRHRVKKTADGESRPTQVAIIKGNATTRYDLETETAELDFLLGRFVTEMRKPEPDEDISMFLDHQIDWRELKKDEEFTTPENLRKIEGKKRFEVKRVPATFDGFKPGDIVGSILGGSGDRFNFALSRRGEEIGASVYRVPGYILNNERDKDNDAELLATLVGNKRHLFYQVTRRDRDMIRVRENLFDRVKAMKARIGAEQRLRQRNIGAIFCNEEGRYPEGNFESIYDAARTNDKIVNALVKEEAACIKKLDKAVRASALFAEVLSDVTGMGTLIAAPILAATVDIRRFQTKEGYKAFCGLHVQSDGRFVRARREHKAAVSELIPVMIDGEEVLARTIAETLDEAEETKTEPKWNRAARQAFYLFVADQCNRRPDSEWGKKLIEYKVKLRAKHTEVVEEGGKKRYTNGHIHKMAIWRTATKFCEFFFKKAWELERRTAKNSQPSAPALPPISMETMAIEGAADAA